MIGGFIYWYQTRLDHQECGRCIERYNNKIKHRTNKNISLRTHNKFSKKSDSFPQKASKYSTKNRKHKKEKKSVSFKDIDEEKEIDNNTDISLESLDSSDHAPIMSGKRKGNKCDQVNVAKSHKTHKIEDEQDDDSVSSLDI